MRQLASLLRQDMVLAWRNGHVAVVIAIAALMIALIVFLPSTIDTGPGELFLDTLPGAPVRAAMLDAGGRSDAMFESREAFEQAMAERKNAIGIILSGSRKQPEVEVITRSAVSQESIRLLQATIDMVLRSARGEGMKPPVVEYIRPQAEVVPANLAGIPIFLAFEVGILGFLLVAVFVFQEKQEGTIKAFRMSPAGLWKYIVSKATVFTILGIGYGFVVVVAGFGFSTNWAAIAALVVWASLFMTLLGLGFAAWFENLSHWFFPGLAVLILNMLPFLSYVYPAFNPAWITAIPSYGLVFSLQEALFPTGDTELVITTLLTGLAWLATAVIFCAASVRARLLKER